MQSLPVELILAIFGYLQDDLESLFSCSLVCHEWVHPARQYLFAVMNTTMPPRLRSKPDSLPQSIVSLVNGASIRVGYIKKLQIEDDVDVPCPPVTLQSSVIYQLIEKLPRLQSLQFVDVPIAPTEFVDGLLDGLSIKSLEINNRAGTVWYPVTSAATVLPLFSVIETLSIITEYPAYWAPYDGIQRLQIQRLHDVRIGHLRLDVTLPQFRLLQDLIDIRSSVGTISLRPHLTLWSDVPEFGPMIRDISSKVVSLTLSHWYAYCRFIKANSTCEFTIFLCICISSVH